MPKFIVYEIWTKATEIDAPDIETAYLNAEPIPRDDLSLANWHAIEVGVDVSLIPTTGALGAQVMS
jgi:hypothetical protein